MKTISFALLLTMASGEASCQAGAALPVNTLTAAQAVQPVGSQRGGIDPAREAAIRKLLELEGITIVLKRLPYELLDDRVRIFSEALPPGNYREKVVNLFAPRLKEKVSSDDIVHVAVSVYDKSFSQSEINDLFSFYNSPLRRKEDAIREQAQREAQSEWDKLLRQWIQEAMTEVMNENPDLRKGFEAAAKRTSRR